MIKFRKKEKIKRIIYVSLSLFSKYSGLSLFNALNRNKNGLIVLMYHKVNELLDNPLSVSVNQFKEQIAYLKRNFNVISLDEALSCIRNDYSFHKRTVLITFDDGYKDNLTNAYPILKKYGCKAVLFIPTEYPGGRTLPHDEFVTVSNPTISWDEISQIQDIFEIGSHGCSHRALTRLSLPKARMEIQYSKEIIEKRIKTPVRAFSYPKGSIGDINDKLEVEVKNAGYQICFTTIPGKNIGLFNQFRICRYNVENFGFKYFKCLLDGSSDILSIKDTRIGYTLKARINKLLGISNK